MKKTVFIIFASATVLVFSNCHSSKKAAAAVPKVTYSNDIQVLVMDNCSPCHIPAKGGNKKPLDTYAAVKENIDEVLHRIQLHPGEKGFMPFKHARLSDSTIAVFLQWKEDQLLQ